MAQNYESDIESEIIIIPTEKTDADVVGSAITAISELSGRWMVETACGGIRVYQLKSKGFKI